MAPDLRDFDGGGIGGGRRCNLVIGATDFGSAGLTPYPQMNARLSDMGSSRSGVSAHPTDGATGNSAEEPTPSGAVAAAAAAAGGGSGGTSIDEYLTVTWSLHEGVSTPIGRLSRHSSFESIFGFDGVEENFPVSPSRHSRRRSYDDVLAIFESLPTNCDPPSAGTSTTVQDLFTEEARGGLVDQMIRETTRKRSAELGRNLKVMNYPGQDTAAHSEKASSRLTAPLKKSLEERKNKVAAAANMKKSTESSSLGQHQQEGGAPGAHGSSQSGQPQQEVADPDLTPPLRSGGSSERGNPSVSSQVWRASASVQPSQPRPCPLHGQQPSHKGSAPANRARRERRKNSEAGAKYLSDHNHLPGWMATEKDFLTTSGQMASGTNGGEIRGGSNGSSDTMAGPGSTAGVPESFSITLCGNRNGSPVPSTAQEACSGKRTNSEMSINLDDNTAPLKRCYYDHGTSSGSLKGRHSKRNPTEPAGDNSATKHRCAERADRNSRKGQATCSECSSPLDEKLQELQHTIEMLTEGIQQKDAMIRFLEKKSAEQVTMMKCQHLTISGLCRVNGSINEINKRLQERVENLGGSAELW